MFRHRGPTSIELSVKNILKKENIRFVTNSNPLRGFTFPDFLLRPEKLAIYVDGNYWHSKSKKKDSLQSKVLRAVGFKVLRFSETEIKQGIDKVRMKILKELR